MRWVAMDHGLHNPQRPCTPPPPLQVALHWSTVHWRNRVRISWADAGAPQPVAAEGVVPCRGRGTGRGSGRGPAGGGHVPGQHVAPGAGQGSC